MALPKGVRSPIDYTKLYMSNELDGNSLNEKKEPQLPKKGNVKSMNQVTIKPDDTFASLGARARGMVNRIFGGTETPERDGVYKDAYSGRKKSKKARIDNVKTYRDVKGTPKNVKYLSGGASKSKGLAKFGKGVVKAISKNPKGALLAGGLIGGVAAARAIGRKFNEIRKKRKNDAITKQVDKYVADRKIPGGPKKVNYKPTNQYTVTRDSKGKVTGTGKLIRVVPGTEFKEETMTPAQKRKDTMLKKKYEKSDDMMDSFKDQYGKKKGKEVFYAFIRKKSMEEELNKDDKPFVKKLVGKLRKGSKTHAKQADDLEKAMKENVMLTYKSGQGFDAKIGNRSVRNTVSNFKTGVDAVKNIKKEGGLVSGIKKTINDKKSTNTKTDVSTNVSDAIKNFKMKENTAIESELLIQDWNKDDIKFTEIETVDIIKAKPLKESKAKLAIQTAKMTGKLFKAMGRKLQSGKVNPFTGNVFAKPGAVKFSRTFAPMDVGGGARVKSQRQLNTFIQGAKENVRTGKGIPSPVKTKFKDTKKGTEIFADKRGINTYPPSPTGEKLKKIRLSTPAKKVRSFDKQMDRYTMGTYKPVMGAAFGASAYQGITGKDPIQQIGDKIKKDDFGPLSPKEIEKQKKRMEKMRQKNMKKEEFSDWRNDLGEDWQKVNRQDKTDGLSKKAVKAYRRENPGSKLKTAVTKDPKKLKKGSKDAKRRLSFCRRMKGMKKKLTSAKTRRDPDSRINKALRRWNC